MNRSREALRAAPALLVLLATWAASTADAAPESCRRVALRVTAAQTFHAVWSYDSTELVVVDLAGGRLLRFAQDGRYVGAVMRPGEGELEFSKPTQIHATREGWLIQDVGRKWVWVDQKFSPLRSLSTSGPDGRPFVQLVDESLWGQELAGFGSYRGADRKWQGALLRVSLKPLEVRQVVEEISFTGKGGNFYGTLLPVVAHAGGQAYFLRFAEPPYLLRANPKTRLKAFPQGFDRLAALPESRGPQSTAARQQALQKATLPVSLYGAGSLLYLLTRRPGDHGTVWQLHQIDPQRDRLIRSLTLPSSASDLVLAPGSSNWAILEKGPVQPNGDQPAANLLFVPAAWIENSKPAGKLECP